MKYFYVSLLCLVTMVSCNVPRTDNVPKKPGATANCVGGGCKPDFSLTINQYGHVTADNIDSKLPDPTTTKPSGNVSILDWLSGVLSPGSLNDNPSSGGGGQGSGTGSGTGSDGSGHGGDGTIVVGDGQTTDPVNIDDPCMTDPINCQQQPPKEAHFEDSELGKLMSGTWKGLNYGFGELTGSNRKKRKEAQALNRRYAEMRVLEAQVNGLVSSINEGSETVMAVVKDLSNDEEFNLTGDTFNQTKTFVNGHNTRMNTLNSDISDIPEPIAMPPSKPIYDTPDLKSVQQARLYRNYVSRQVEAGPDSTKVFGRQLVGVADSALNYSEEAYRAGDKEKGDFAKELAVTALDIALSLTPGVGLGKDIYEASTGKNLLTGKPLTGFEQSMAVFGILTAGYGSKLAILGKIGVIADVLKSANKEAQAVADIAKATEKAAEIAEASAKAGVKEKAIIDDVVEWVKDGLPCTAFIHSRPGGINIFWLFEDVAMAADCIPGQAEKAVQGILESAADIKKSYAGQNVPWTSTKKYPDSAVNAAKHWSKHGKEFPDLKSAKEYTDKAVSMVKDPPLGSLSKSAKNGTDTVMYHPDSNTMVIHSGNLPSSMYRPDPLVHGYPSNLDYFNKYLF